MEKTREHILATAFELFFKKGYKEVTMSELVAASGMSKGAFYHYFSSKEDLYNHSMEMFLAHYLDTFKLEFDEKISLKQNLKNLFHRFAPLTDQMNTSNQEAADGLSNYLVFLQEMMRKPDFRVKMESYNRHFFSEFTVWIEQAQSRGEIRDNLDPKILAHHFAGLMKGVSVLYAFVDQSEPLSQTFNKIVDQFFSLIETVPNEKVH